MAVAIGFLRRIVSRYLVSAPAGSGVGQRIQEMEQEAARQRLLDQTRGAHQQSATGSRQRF